MADYKSACARNSAGSPPPMTLTANTSFDNHWKSYMEHIRGELGIMNRAGKVPRSGFEASRSSQDAQQPYAKNVKKLSVGTIAKLFDDFDGNKKMYDTWEKKLMLYIKANNLTYAESQSLIVSKLKGKALKWLSSKTEIGQYSIQQILTEMKAKFCHETDEKARRRRFDKYTWKRGETFTKYFHEKVSLAAGLPIKGDKLVECIIEGIPDITLRNQAYIQRFSTKEALLAAFKKVQLPLSKRAEKQPVSKTSVKNIRDRKKSPVGVAAAGADTKLASSSVRQPMSGARESHGLGFVNVHVDVNTGVSAMQHKRPQRNVRFTKHQNDSLEKLFQRTTNPDEAKREKLASKIGLTPKQVKTWFENRRRKDRTQLTEGGTHGTLEKRSNDYTVYPLSAWF